MASGAIAVFTHENLATILRQGGSHAWHVEPRRAAEREFLVCAQNRQHPKFREPGASHRAGFMVGRIAGVSQSYIKPDRQFIQIDAYCEIDLPDAWTQRNPVRYTTLEALGIDRTSLPPLIPLAPPAATGMAEMSVQPIAGAPAWTSARPPPRAAGPDTWRRLDAILAQLDRVPDLPVPLDPLDWDEHGLPR